MSSMFKNPQDYFGKMKKYAVSVSSKTGLDPILVMAQWGLESGYGTSELCNRDNNHAGIKKNSKGSDFPSASNGGKYAGYTSIGHFANDYARIMNLEMYAPVRNAKGLDAQVIALGNSPWAEDKGYSSKIADIIKKNNLGNVTAVNSDLWGTKLATLLGDAKGRAEFINAILTNPIIWIVGILFFIFRK